MSLILERKIQVNRWIMNARWYYLLGVVLIGVFARILGQYNLEMSFIASIALVTLLVNVIFFLCLKKLAVNDKRGVSFLSFAQVVFEIVIFSLVFYKAGGLESVTGIFIVIPIISSALLFGPGGAFVTSVISGLMLSGIVYMEFNEIIPHYYRYDVVEVPEYMYPMMAVTKVVALFLFFVLIGFYSGLSSRLLFRREGVIQRKTVELSKLNNILDSKVIALRESENKTQQAFKNLRLIEDELHEEHERIESLIMNMIDPVIMIDENQKISLLNQAARIVLGMKNTDVGTWISSRSNFTLKNFQKVIRRRNKITDTKELETGDKGEEMIEIKGRDYSLHFKVITIPVNNKKGEYIGVLKVFYNITREKGLEHLKSEFITVAAHQLRTPLSAVKWAIKMVMDNEEGNLNEEQLRFLERGYKSNERVIVLVNDMLNVSRIEEGRFGFKMRGGHIEVLLSFVLDNVKDKFIEKKITLSAQIPENIPKLKFDGEKLGMALENILDNAIKYTPAGGTVKLKVDVFRRYLKISIQDSGIGIPEDGQKKIFGRFYRAENALKVETDGSGLGLYIVKNIIDKHKGKISFSSVEGKGSEFVIQLPLA